MVQPRFITPDPVGARGAAIRVSDRGQANRWDTASASRTWACPEVTGIDVAPSYTAEG